MLRLINKKHLRKITVKTITKAFDNFMIKHFFGEFQQVTEKNEQRWIKDFSF